MRYLYSDIDRKNVGWFENDAESKSLKSINLVQGQIRGLYPCTINFNYPIAAIAGENGSGKSTILAMACCAYHNSDAGYIPSDRNKSYYTFSDFFVQTKDEVKVEGIYIRYGIFARWNDGQIKIGYQRRRKKRGGKWTKYDKRVKRNVIFLGIQRIVPPGERKTERSYSGRFKSSKLDHSTQKKILDIASKILGKKYTTLDMRTVDKRRLFVVDRKEKHYSGFNMGAGENAVFSLLIELFSAGRNTLLVIDEIELGLHESAQKRLINELKKLCVELHCQVICSTHSSVILYQLPPEGRFYLEACNEKTNIISHISPRYAMGKLSGGEKKELTVFVEDGVGESILRGLLSSEVLRRIRIISIGSDQAVLKQLAAAYRESNNSCMAFCDGDKRLEYNKAITQVKKHLETRVGEDVDEWIQCRLKYLPGDVWPEKYSLETIEDSTFIREELFELWKVEKDHDDEIIERALQSGKHNEFYYLAEQLNQDEEQVKMDVIRMVGKIIPEEVQSMENDIKVLLEYC